MKEHYLCGYTHTTAAKANMRKASLLRESTIQRKVSVDGMVYGNLTRAGEALGMHAATVRRRAHSEDKRYKNYFFIDKE